MNPVCHICLLLPVLFLMVIGCLYFISYNQDRNNDEPEVDCGALFLTLYIENNQTEKGRKLATVPPMLKNIESFSGYLTVNKTTDSNLFFWLFKSQQGNWEERPLVVWLQGGPGATLLLGLFHEVGPFSVAKGLELVPRKYSWNRKYNLVFFDNPVGTGFSFTKMESGYARDENDVSGDLYEAIVQLYKLFPNLQKNKLFITGESYGGKFVTAIGYKIYKMNQVSPFKMNLAGLMIGDGWIDPINQSNYAPLLYKLGLIDKNTQNRLILLEAKIKALIKDENFSAAHKAREHEMAEIKAITGLKSVFDFIDDRVWSYTLAEEFITKNRAALHVGKCKFNSNKVLVHTHLLNDDMQSVRPWVEELLTAEEFPIMFYSGQLDITDAYSVSVDFYNALEWPRAQEYHNARRCQFKVESVVAGYYKTAGSFTEVLVRDAGHMVPVKQPKWVFELLDRFITNSSSFKCK